MSPSKITKSFFGSHSKTKCHQCSEGYLQKEISITVSKPLDEDDYLGLLFWDHEPNHKTFILSNHNYDEHEYIFANQAPEVSSLTDLKDTCRQICRLGYNLDSIQLFNECSNIDCRFAHRTILEWSKENNSLVVDAELVILADVVLRQDYNMSATIITIPGKKIQKYEFKLLDISIQKYNRLNNKIKQILLIG